MGSRTAHVFFPHGHGSAGAQWAKSLYEPHTTQDAVFVARAAAVHCGALRGWEPETGWAGQTWEHLGLAAGRVQVSDVVSQALGLVCAVGLGEVETEHALPTLTCRCSPEPGEEL